MSGRHTTDLADLRARAALLGETVVTGPLGVGLRRTDAGPHATELWFDDCARAADYVENAIADAEAEKAEAGLEAASTAGTRDVLAEQRRADAVRAADYHDATTAGELIDAISGELAEGDMPPSLRGVLVELLSRLAARLDAVGEVRTSMDHYACATPDQRSAQVVASYVDDLDQALTGGGA